MKKLLNLQDYADLNLSDIETFIICAPRLTQQVGESFQGMHMAISHLGGKAPDLSGEYITTVPLARLDNAMSEIQRLKEALMKVAESSHQRCDYLGENCHVAIAEKALKECQ